jgi:hypothetical protein
VDKQGMFDHDPVMITIYASKNGLLDTPRWLLPGLKKLAKSQKRLLRMAKQAKLQLFRTKPIYMYRFLVPQNNKQAMQLDKENRNTLWRDAEILELRQINEYNTFIDKSVGYVPGPEYKKIKVHMVYAVKLDCRHKA